MQSTKLKCLRYAALSVIVCTLTVPTTCLAQETTSDKVILYNSVPVEVELTDNGDIKRFKKERPNHLKGYIIDTKPAVNDRAIVDMSAPTTTTEQGQAVATKDMRIRFTPGDSGDLDPNSLDVLNSIIGTLKGGLYQQVVLKAKDEVDVTARELNNKRLANCKKYLNAQGISSDRILTTLSPTVLDTDTVTLDYL